MTWSFNTSLATDMDKVRLFIGDIDTTDQLLSDETILAMLVDEPHVKLCASQACLFLAAKYGRITSYTIGALTISDAAGRVSNWRALADRLRQEANLDAVTRATIKVGGTTFTQQDRMDSNDDAFPSKFRRGQFSYPGTEESHDSDRRRGS